MYSLALPSFVLTTTAFTYFYYARELGEEIASHILL